MLDLTSGYVTIPSFFPDANRLRDLFEKHFREPHRHDRHHQIWNYWHVPEAYTYLRTSPEKIFPKERIS